RRFANARRHRHTAIDDHTVDAFARRVEQARDVDDVAELERIERVAADGGRQVDLAHADVVEPVYWSGCRAPGLICWSGCRVPGLIRGWPVRGGTRLRHSMPSRR